MVHEKGHISALFFVQFLGLHRAGAQSVESAQGCWGRRSALKSLEPQDHFLRKLLEPFQEFLRSFLVVGLEPVKVDIRQTTVFDAPLAVDHHVLSLECPRE